MSKRVIGRTGILLTAVGGIIGSGWLFGPYFASQIAGPAAILAWLIGAVLMMVVALTFAELTAMLPIMGGIARFSHFSHGTWVSFTMSWCGWISSIVVAPIETMALLQYASNYLPELATKSEEVHHLTPFGVLVAALVMLLMCCINAWGVKIVTRANSWIVALKIIIPAGSAIALLSHAPHFGNFTAQGFAPYGLKNILLTLPTAGIIFSLIGYNTAIMMAGESKNPQKNIPFAIIGALLTCSIIYILVQVAFIAAVQPSMISGGWHLLQFKGDGGPFAGLASSIGMNWLALILFIDAVISPFGTGLVYTSSSSRMNYAMSQNGYMPRFMQKLSRRHAPVLATLVNYILGLLLFLPFPGWQSMMTFLISAFILSYAVGPIACFALRKTMPHTKRPFRLPCEPLFSITAFYISNLLVFWTGWHTFSKILIAIAFGYILLLLTKWLQRERKLHLDLKAGLWIFPYYIGLGVISYLGSFDGRGIIPFGWDFLAIFLLSVVIFYLSIISRVKPTKPYELPSETMPII